MASALTSHGRARGRTPGGALQQTRRAKDCRYPELLASQRCRPVELGFEIDGRWSGGEGTECDCLRVAEHRLARACSG
eukprot:11186760-Lingulodinium_polyedra.AAC.1